MVVLLHPVCILLSGMLHVYKSEEHVAIFETWWPPKHWLRSIRRLKIVELVDECESVQSKVALIETNQICLKIFSLAVDKRTQNNLYMHWVSVVIIYSSIETFASIKLTFVWIEWTLDRNNLQSNLLSIVWTCILKLQEARRNEAFQIIIDFTLLHVLSPNSK